MKKYLIFLFLISSIVYAQNPKWINYTTNYDVSALIEANNFIWAGGRSGLVKINKVTGNTTFYDRLNSGLPDNRINTIATDSSGNLWIGTDNGLVKYDGTKWTLYNNSNSGLLNNYIEMIQIYKNNVWIAGGTGLNKFDGTNWVAYNTSNSGLPDNNIQSFKIDHQGNKWIGTYLRGLVKFNDKTWTIYNTENSELTNNYVSAIAIDKNNNKWIGTFSDYKPGYKILKFNDTAWTVYDTSNSELKENLISAIQIDNFNNVYVGTYYGGLAKFDGTRWTIYNSSNSGLPSNNINFNSSIIDNNNNYWVGTDSGLVKFNGTTWTKYNTSNSGLTSNNIISTAIDQNGNKWILSGTDLIKFDGTIWTNYSHPDFNSYNNFNSLLIDNKGIKWLGMGYYNGLAKFDNSSWTVYTNSSSGYPFYDVPTCIAIDVIGNIWVGSYGKGMAKFNGTAWKVYDTSNSDLPSNYIKSMAIDLNGNQWIGTDSGIAKFDGIKWTVYNKLNSGFSLDYVNVITIDNHNNKWFGTQNGVTKFNDSTWINYNSSNSGLLGPFISSIVIDDFGVKWIGTYNYNLEAGIWKSVELAKFDDTTWTVFNSSNSGLPNSIITSISIEKNCNKWIGTAYGLFVFNENGIVTKTETSNNIITSNFELSQNYPNPFNPTTTINYSLPKSGLVTIKIYDILGREIKTLINAENNAGNYSVQFDGSNLSSGIYFYRMQSGNFSQTKKLILLK